MGRRWSPDHRTARLWQNPRIEILRTDSSLALPITGRPYNVSLVSAVELAEGEGEAHAYVQYIDPGGEIGPHRAEFGQLYLAVSGSGWVAGGDGRRVPLAQGQVAHIQRGEIPCVPETEFADVRRGSLVGAYSSRLGL